MTSKTFFVLVLFCVALFALTFVFSSEQEVSEERQAVLSAQTVDAIVTIVVSREGAALQGDTSTEIEKGEAGEWRGTKAHTSVDVKSVARFLANLKGLHAYRKGAESFSKPETVILFRLDDQSEVILQIGREIVAQQYRWVRVILGPKRKQEMSVFLVDDYLVRDLVSEIENWKNVSLFPQGTISIATMQWRNDENQISLGPKESSWRQEGQLSFTTDAGSWGHLYQLITQLRFTSLQQESCLSPVSQWEVTLANGEIASLKQCGDCNEDTKRLSIGALQGCVPTSSWSPIATFLNTPSKMVSPEILPSLQERAFSLECRGKTIEVKPSDMDRQRIAEWRDTINASGRGVQSGSGMDVVCDLRQGDFGASFGKRGEHWFVRKANETGLRTLTPEVALLLKAELGLFLSLEMLREEAAFALSLRVQEKNVLWEFQRGEILGSWTSTHSEISASRVKVFATALAKELTNIEAQEFVNEELKASRIRSIEIQFESPLQSPSHSYRIEVRGDSSQCTVQVDSGPYAKVDTKTCEHLLRQP